MFQGAQVAVTVLRQFAELLYDESSKRTEVTRQYYAGLASGESVVRLLVTV